jgi:15-cis-phytoene synthase/lycopene beta-cyclase
MFHEPPYASHVIFTLPPTFLLHLALRPMMSSRDTFRLIFLVTVAVSYTLPWDSYIIKNKVSFPNLQAIILWGKKTPWIEKRELLRFHI